MKFADPEIDLDEIDLHIVSLLQENCKLPLAKIGDKVGLSAPAVVERVKKLEDSGVVAAYRAILDARLLGKDVTAFIGVSIAHPRRIAEFEAAVASIDDVLECHHVTGDESFILKVKAANTGALEKLLGDIRSVEGVTRTVTSVVLSTAKERLTLELDAGLAENVAAKKK